MRLSAVPVTAAALDRKSSVDAEFWLGCLGRAASVQGINSVSKWCKSRRTTNAEIESLILFYTCSESMVNNQK